MGRDFVIELLKNNTVDEIWMIARRENRLKELMQRCPGRLRPVILDLSKLKSFEYLKESLKQEKVQIQYLINGAGMGRMGTAASISWEDHAALVDLNVRALTCMTGICLPYMGKGSHIIHLASGSAFVPQPGFASYAAGKSYVLSFSRALRAELKPQKISVTAVCPGPVRTEFFEAAKSTVDPMKEKFMAESTAVVKQALNDAEEGKELSIYGMSMKLVHLAGKLLPQRLLIWFMYKNMTKGQKKR